MFTIIIFAEISIGSLFSGYMPESATLMALGISLIISSVGLRRVLKHRKNRKIEEVTSKEIKADRNA